MLKIGRYDLVIKSTYLFVEEFSRYNRKIIDFLIDQKQKENANHTQITLELHKIRKLKHKELLRGISMVINYFQHDGP